MAEQLSRQEIEQFNITTGPLEAEELIVVIAERTVRGEFVKIAEANGLAPNVESRGEGGSIAWRKVMAQALTDH